MNVIETLTGSGLNGKIKLGDWDMRKRIGIFILGLVILFGLGVGGVNLHAYLQDRQTYRAMVAKPSEVAKWSADDHPLISHSQFQKDVHETLNRNKGVKAVKKNQAAKSFVIPGLRGAWSINHQTKRLAFGTDWVPQGITETPKDYYISAYDGSHRLNSLIFMVSKRTGKYEKSLLLPTKSHVGGITYDQGHHRLWWSTDHTQFAGLSYASMSTIQSYDAQKVHRPIQTKSISIPWANRTSGIEFYNNKMAIIQYGANKANRQVIFVGLNAQTGLPAKNISQIPALQGNLSLYGYLDALFKQGQLMSVANGYDRMQGIAITRDGITIISQSNGNRDSKLIVRQSNLTAGPEFTFSTKNISGSTSLIVPPSVEQISINKPTNSRVALLFESGAKKYREEGSYRHRPEITDRVLVLPLDITQQK
ncbi:hypothetical protein [Levilactobacillus bambusae]|uniref:Uncharacterized protein n=1 Tax=Levilactobacillus bambusae TaxID=2024736 RepID=A0A2V1MZZ7_9LACO|nr:hypothetical protein [Levilactobacillus bambusae]PWG00343.1 hypothetical protein DCM90_05275 [Levilactobacillus bambusae]